MSPAALGKLWSEVKQDGVPACLNCKAFQSNVFMPDRCAVHDCIVDWSHTCNRFSTKA
jgi:hypothetical protein